MLIHQSIKAYIYKQALGKSMSVNPLYTYCSMQSLLKISRVNSGINSSQWKNFAEFFVVRPPSN
jgi:hypothetical protein